MGFLWLEETDGGTPLMQQFTGRGGREDAVMPLFRNRWAGEALQGDSQAILYWSREVSEIQNQKQEDLREGRQTVHETDNLKAG